MHQTLFNRMRVGVTILDASPSGTFSLGLFLARTLLSTLLYMTSFRTSQVGYILTYILDDSSQYSYQSCCADVQCNVFETLHNVCSRLTVKLWHLEACCHL